MIDFKEKADIFNDVFIKQCSLDNDNNKLSSVLSRKMWKLLKVELLINCILKIIRNLNPKKAPYHDMIRIRMLKICDESICKPWKITFWSCLEKGKFPSDQCGSCLKKE